MYAYKMRMCATEITFFFFAYDYTFHNDIGECAVSWDVCNMLRVITCAPETSRLAKPPERNHVSVQRAMEKENVDIAVERKRG